MAGVDLSLFFVDIVSCYIVLALPLSIIVNINFSIFAF